MDDVRIYNRALSQAEIMSDMQNSLSPVYTQPYDRHTQRLSDDSVRRRFNEDDQTPNVTWSISPNLGTISASGLYTAPVSINTQQIVTVTATSLNDPSKVATAQITLLQAFITPATVTLYPWQGQEFVATVAVNSYATPPVTWSLSPNVGTLSLWSFLVSLVFCAKCITTSADRDVNRHEPSRQQQAAMAQITLSPPSPYPLALWVRYFPFADTAIQCNRYQHPEHCGNLVNFIGHNRWEWLLYRPRNKCHATDSVDLGG